MKTFSYQPLPKPTDRMDHYYEIGMKYNDELHEHFNALTPQERVLAYYLYRASLPGDMIAKKELHRHSCEIITILERLVEHADELVSHSSELGFDSEKFINEVKTYLVYFWVNHSHYFVGEHAHEKRTPERLGLKTLTKDNLLKALLFLNYPDATRKIEELTPAIFDRNYEPTLVVPGTITASAVNFYSPDFTDEDFDTLDTKDAHAINGYFYIDNTQGKRTPAMRRVSVGDLYSKELEVSVFWLEKALAHAKQYPNQFDEHFITSIDYLISFFKSGDEELFKKHCIAWTKSNSRIDYSIGPVETYSDPKSYRGHFQAEATIKTVDMAKLNQILPKIEAALPFPSAFKRDNLDDISSIPNASINTKIFAFGGLGPLNVVLAYCLPNYEEIRSKHGSKQVIFGGSKSLAELIDKDSYHKLFDSAAYRAWADQYDPKYELDNALFKLLVILHETIGHASGKLATHTFGDNEALSIGGVEYAVGQTIELSSDTLNELLSGYGQSLEEMRAEIIALVGAIVGYDDLARAGFLGEWPQKIEKNKMIELLIRNMARQGVSRLRSQQVDTTEIAGDHARANTAILNYLIEKGCVRYVIEKIGLRGAEHTVVDVEVVDLERAIQDVIDLANEVQRIKSTGDRRAVILLMERYGKPVYHPEFIPFLKENQRALVGDLRMSGFITPLFEKIKNEQGDIIDVQAMWPRDIFDLQKRVKPLIYATD